MRKDDFIISTTHFLEGYSIEKYLGIVTDRIVVGVDVFSEFFASFSDALGGRSKIFENRINELHGQVLAKMKKQAIAMGANSIIGVSLDTDEISGKNKLMFMATVAGTAVIIKKKHGNEELQFNEEYHNIITSEEVENLILMNKCIDKLSNKNLPLNDLKLTLHELNNNDLLVAVDIIIDALIRIDYVDLSKDTTDNIINYLSKFNKSELTEKLNKRLINSSIKSNFFYTIYEQVAMINYQDISTMISKVDITILEKTIFKQLLKFKETYNYNDIKYIELIIDQLNNLLNNNVIEKYQGPLSSGWVCLCGTKNTDTSNYCKKCTKGKSGLTYEQISEINKIIEHLIKIKMVLGQI